VTEPLRDRLAGRWGDVLPQLGIPAEALTNRNCACPLCGGKDRFRFTPSKGLYVCNKCGGGDGINLVMLKNGWDFKTVALHIEPLLGNAKVAKRAAPSEFDRRRALNALWASSKPITPECPAGLYLTARCGIAKYPACLRAVDSLRYWGDGVARYYPGLVAMVSAPDGRGTSIFRTWLTREGDKASVDVPRRMMPGNVVRGSAVRLWPPHSGTIGVGEGIESCISAAILHKIPVWSLLGTASFQTWIPPEGVKRVIVFGDADKNYAGQAAAYTLAHRLLALPNRPLEVDVRIPGVPEPSGHDWNDVHRQEVQSSLARRSAS
jgi:putative DNA primase/helicase